MTMLAVTIAMFSIFITLFFLADVVISAPNYSTFTKIEMPSGVTGPESAGFDNIGQGPYVTVQDGRILKWQPLLGRFVYFAHTSPNRNATLCDGTTNPDLWPTCGRPIAISFNSLSSILYITDAYYGLLAVGPSGGLAKQVATFAEGGPFKYLTGVDVDVCLFSSGNVYFKDASLNFEIRERLLPKWANDSTGRFMKYDPQTNQVTVLLKDLKGGGGPAVSKDGSYVLVPEYGAGRVSKYWLTGPKANSAERILSVAGNVNKIKRADTDGEFWVATMIIETQNSVIRRIPQGLKINGSGAVVKTVSFEAQFFNKTISVVQEQKGALYVGSRDTNFLGKYSD